MKQVAFHGKKGTETCKISQKNATHEYKVWVLKIRVQRLQGPIFKSTDYSVSFDKSACRCYAKLPHRCSATPNPSQRGVRCCAPPEMDSRTTDITAPPQITCRQTFDTSGHPGLQRGHDMVRSRQSVWRCGGWCGGDTGRQPTSPPQHNIFPAATQHIPSIISLRQKVH